ncbi:hypothetical protein ACFL3U_02185 [Pseudomonadota bacterium]
MNHNNQSGIFSQLQFALIFILGIAISNPLLAAQERAAATPTQYQMEFTFDVTNISRGNIQVATVDIPNKILAAIQEGGFIVDSFFDISYEVSHNPDKGFDTEMVSMSLRATSRSANASQPGAVIGVVYEALGCCRTHRGHVTVLK